MRKIIITFLILISLTATSCKDTATDPITDETTTTVVTTTTVAEELIPPETYLPAIIDDLKTSLSADDYEYDTFMRTLKFLLLHLNNQDEEGISAELAVCNMLAEEFSLSASLPSMLSADERKAIAQLGMNAEDYNGIFDNYAWLRNSKANVMTGLVQNFNDLDTYGDVLDIIVQFYIDYNTIFQQDLYYSVNMLINDCTVESEIIDEFKNNFYPSISEMTWGNDNNVILEKCKQLEADMEIIVADFQLKTADLIGATDE